MADSTPSATVPGVVPPVAATAPASAADPGRVPAAPGFWRAYRVPLWSALVLLLFVIGWEWGFRALRAKCHSAERDRQQFCAYGASTRATRRSSFEC
jgi:hypothetical protein